MVILGQQGDSGFNAIYPPAIKLASDTTFVLPAIAPVPSMRIGLAK
jgi:hypothetical protein